MVFWNLVIKRTIVADLILVRTWTSSLYQVDARSSGTIATVYHVLNVTRLQTLVFHRGAGQLLCWDLPVSSSIQRADHDDRDDQQDSGTVRSGGFFLQWL